MGIMGNDKRDSLVLRPTAQEDMDMDMEDTNVTREFPFTLFPTIPRKGTKNDRGQGHGSGRNIADGFRELTALPGFYGYQRPDFESVRCGGYKIRRLSSPVDLEPDDTYVPNLPLFQWEKPPPSIHHPIASMEAVRNSGLFSELELQCLESFPDLTKIDSSSLGFKILFANLKKKYRISNSGFFNSSSVSSEDETQCLVPRIKTITLLE